MFELLFSYSPEIFAQSRLILSTLFGTTTLLVLLVLGWVATLASLMYFRSHLGLWKLTLVGLLQGLALSLILVMLAQPVLELDQLRAGDNKVLVLLDTSASMALSDDGETTRLEHALPLIENNLINPLQRNYQVELRAFGEQLVPLESLDLLPPPARRTYLAGSLLAALDSAANESVGAVVLISDGGDNGPAPENWTLELAASGIPVHTVGIGREVMTEDVEIVSVSLPQKAVPGIRLAGSVEVRSGTARQVQLKIYDHNNILALEDIILPGGGQISRHAFTLPTGAIGLRQLRFVIDPQPGERILANNEYLHALTVAAREPRVLYVEGEPRWEYKFIRRAVETESFLHLHTLLRTSPNRIYRQGLDTPDQLADGFPTRAEDLFGYDALLIGTQEAASFSPAQFELMRTFVNERGGAILFLGGRRSLTDGDWQNTPINDLLPVVLPERSTTFARRQVQVQPTAVGWRADWLRLASDDNANRAAWQALPALADYQLIGTPKPGAQTLLEVQLPGQNVPLLVSQRYGRGRVMVLATGGTWRWQMQMPSQDLSHQTFWRQLLQELVRETPPRIEILTRQNWYRDEDRIEIEARIRSPDFRPHDNAQLEVTLIPERGSPTNLPFSAVPGRPGAYLAATTIPETGPVQLDVVVRDGETELHTERLFINRTDHVAEHFDPAQNRALMERIAAQTGARYWTLDNLSGLPDQIRFSPAGISERQWLPLWSMPVNFLLLLLLKSLEWLLRRHWGHL